MTISEFFKAIVGDLNRVDLRAIRDRKFKGGQIGGNLATFIKEHNGVNDVYFGVLPRPIGDTAGVLWVDIDFKHTPEPEARERLGNFSPAPHIVVASGGGLHAYWRIDPPIPTAELKGTLKALVKELGADPVSTDAARILRVPKTRNMKYEDTRICTIESVATDLGPYMICDFNLDITHEKAQDVTDDQEVNDEPASEASIIKAQAFVDAYPPAIEGQGGDNHTFVLCAALAKDFALSFDQAWAMLLPWNETCQGPWDLSELEIKLNNAFNHGQGVIGSEDPKRDFSKVAEEDANAPKTPTTLEKLDAKYHVVDYNGQSRVFYEDPHGTLGPCWKSYDVRNFVETLTLVYGLPVTQVKGRGSVPVARLWLESTRPEKRTYTGFTFDPSGQSPSSVFNIWAGLGVKPEAGDWSMVNELIHDVLADNDEATYKYILDWCAMAVQKPWIKPGTTIVFSGEQGTGKSAFGKMFSYLFGRHGMRLDDSTQVTGRFNDHLADKVGLFVDEAFWSRDHKAEAVIKGLITDETKMIEAKFQGLRIERSYLHIIMASNNEYVANVTGDDERRYAVFQPGAKKPYDFYKELIGNDFTPNWIKFMPAFLDALLKRDISQFHPVDRPKTEAYEMQRTISMDPIKSWLWDFVENDYSDPNGLIIEVKDRVFKKNDLRESFLQYVKGYGRYVPPEYANSGYFEKKLMKLAGILSRKITFEGKRQNCVMFPPIEEVRKRIGMPDDVDDLI